MMQSKPGNTHKRHANFKGKKTGTKKQQKKLTIAKVKCRAWCRAWSRDLVENTGIAESTERCCDRQLVGKKCSHSLKQI